MATRTVWKQAVEVSDKSTHIRMPTTTKPLYVAMQYGRPTVWFEVDPDPSRLSGTCEFRIFGTGHQIPRGWEYVGTCIDRKLHLVWHVYWKPWE